MSITGFYITMQHNPNEVREVIDVGSGLYKIKYIKSKTYKLGTYVGRYWRNKGLMDRYDLEDYLDTRNYKKIEDPMKLPADQYLSAKQARILTEEYNKREQLVDAQLQHRLKGIKVAASQGHSALEGSTEMYTEVHSQLLELGYKVTTRRNRKNVLSNDWTYGWTITW